MNDEVPEHISPTSTSPPGGAGVPRWLIAVLVGGGLVIVALLAVVILLLTNGGEPEDSSSSTVKDEEAKTFLVQGDLTLISADNQLTGSGGGCLGGGGYDDIVPGAQVVIRDSTGATVAVDQLEPGTKTDSYVTCVFPFEVQDVPSGKGPYSVEVSHRGEISFNEDDAGDLHFTLG